MMKINVCGTLHFHILSLNLLNYTYYNIGAIILIDEKPENQII